MNLIKSRANYGTKIAVDRLTLSIQPGELFALLGPNGAGKTTTIKMLVGLLRPTSGTVRICSYDVVRETRQANRCMGYVPDEPYLYEKLSGREFLQFIADLYGLGREESATRIAREIRNFESGGIRRSNDRKLFARHEAAIGVCRRPVARSGRVGAR